MIANQSEVRVADSDCWVSEYRTTAATDAELAVTSHTGKRDVWQAINASLASWATRPLDFADPDEGIEAPTRDAIFIARELVRLLRPGKPAPTRMVSDGEGGISFEWSAGDSAEYLEVSAEGDIEQKRFEQKKLVQRRQISVSF